MFTLNLPVDHTARQHVLAAFQEFNHIEAAEQALEEEVEKALYAEVLQQQIKAVARKIVRGEPRARRAA